MDGQCWGCLEEPGLLKFDGHIWCADCHVEAVREAEAEFDDSDRYDWHAAEDFSDWGMDR